MIRGGPNIRTPPPPAPLNWPESAVQRSLRSSSRSTLLREIRPDSTRLHCHTSVKILIPSRTISSALVIRKQSVERQPFCKAQNWDSSNHLWKLYNVGRFRATYSPSFRNISDSGSFIILCPPFQWSGFHSSNLGLRGLKRRHFSLQPPTGRSVRPERWVKITITIQPSMDKTCREATIITKLSSIW
jgi:hypothetical protein